MVLLEYTSVESVGGSSHVLSNMAGVDSNTILFPSTVYEL